MTKSNIKAGVIKKQPYMVFLEKKHIGHRLWSMKLKFSKDISGYFDDERMESFEHKDSFKCTVVEEDNTLLLTGTFTDCKEAILHAIADFCMRKQNDIVHEMIDNEEIDPEDYKDFLEENTDIREDTSIFELHEIIYDQHLDNLEEYVDVLLESEQSNLAFGITDYITKSFELKFHTYIVLRCLNYIPSEYIPRSSALFYISKNEENDWIIANSNREVIKVIPKTNYVPDGQTPFLTPEKMDEIELISGIDEIPGSQFTQLFIFVGYHPSFALYECFESLTHNPNCICLVDDLYFPDYEDVKEKIMRGISGNNGLMS